MSARMRLSLRLILLVTVIQQATSQTDAPTNRCDEFTCADGHGCTYWAYRCDGDNDCVDGSDENYEMCQSVPCYDYEVDCPETRLKGEFPSCIYEAWVCDGEDDCPYGEDEMDCGVDCDSSTEFSCLESCISLDKRCDYKADCQEGEDEKDCDYPVCGEEHFQCESRQCIPLSKKCDGTKDCLHGDDERHASCSEEFTCAALEFQCATTNKCLDPQKDLCNGDNDCGDNSDENCGKNECTDGTHNCTQLCEDRLSGYQCLCREGYELDSDRHTCNEVDECVTVPGACSQVCVNNPGSYQCSCGAGYTLHDGRSCVKDDNIEPYLVLANKLSTRKYTLESDELSKMHNVEHDSVYLLDYDYREEMLYFADYTANVIKSVRFNGSDETVLDRHHALGAEGIAFDWITKNLYWTNRLVQCVYVSRPDGTSVMQLLKGLTTQPRGIVLDPRPGSGYLFWTDWSLSPFIGRAGMDGTGFKKIITEDLFWPNGLTIDYTTNRFWWVDAYLDRIEYANYDGLDRHIVKESVPHVYAIANFGEWMYWTEWNVKRVEKANKFTGENQHILINSTHLPYDIHVVHPLRQPIVPNPCANNGGCSDLCLIELGGNSVVCACPQHFKLGDDGKTCNADCSDAQFECVSEKKCIPHYWYCDGEMDCNDGSDEPATCPQRYCQQGVFECDDSTRSDPDCTSFGAVCDGIKDCDDNSDETKDMCDARQCPPNLFRCNSGQCIPMPYACDLEADCGDASDEHPANQQCRTGGCLPHEFQCDNGKCVHKLWVCDWDNDCEDWSDEPAETCWQNVTCPDGWRHCRTNYRCVPASAFCNEDDDCRDNSDEEVDRCEACDPIGDFTCANGRCIPKRWKCDYDNDCGDNSDEDSCEPIERPACDPDRQWQCANLYCIWNAQKCDHRHNCGDFSDELPETCEEHTCEPGLYQCDSGHCVSENMRCDRRRNCLVDASDEIDCIYPPELESCGEFQFECGTNVCIPNLWICDGDDDCGDSSDETTALCKETVCGDTLFRCDNHRCIHDWLTCDGEDDCGDGSDENNHEYCRQRALEGLRPCYFDEFQCANGNCVSLDTDMCNEYDDCGDGSDEQSCHGMDGGLSCATTTKNCTDTCKNITGGGYVCQCSQYFAVNPDDDHKCVDIDECLVLNGHCPQLCVNEDGGHTCDCYTSFGKDDDELYGHVCNADEVYGRPSLLVSTGTVIQQVVLSSNSTEHTISSPIIGERTIKAMALDTQRNLVYWTDAPQKKVKRARLPTSTGEAYAIPQDLGFKHLEEPFGIAFDFYSNNIYFTDATNRKIYMSRSDGNYYKTVLTTPHVRPTYIAVNPLTRKMFWIEQSGSEGSLHSAQLDGLMSQTLKEGLGAPTDLTVDYYTGRVYWSDPVLETIESVNDTGGDHTRVLKRGLHKPFSMDIFEGDIYYGSEVKGTVFRHDKFGRGVNVSMVSDMWPPYALKIMHPLKQPRGTEYPANNCLARNCPGLCVNSARGQQCLCPDGTQVNHPDGYYECRLSMVELVQRLIPDTCECLNGGSCVVTETDYVCHCTEGFYGHRCEADGTTALPTTPTPSPTATTTTRVPPPRTTPTARPPPAKTTTTTTTTTTTAAGATSTAKASPITDKKSTTNAAAIAVPVVIVAVLLVLIFAVLFYLFRSGRLGATKGPSGRAEYRTGAPGMESANVSVSNDNYGASASVMEPVDFGEAGIANPTYEKMQKEQIAGVGDISQPYANIDISGADSNGNAAALPSKQLPEIDA